MVIASLRNCSELIQFAAYSHPIASHLISFLSNFPISIFQSKNGRLYLVLNSVRASASLCGSQEERRDKGEREISKGKGWGCDVGEIVNVNRSQGK